MERAGEKLKRIRERLNLTFRDVEQASQQIAGRMGNPEFIIALSRLADIENKGTVPTIYRLYTLCAIYRLDFAEILAWYGAPLDRLASEAMSVRLAETHPVAFGAGDKAADWPVLADGEIDLDTTAFLSHLILSWGKTPHAQSSSRADLRRYRYGLIGFQDRSMYPVLHPGSLVVIDERARIVSEGWTNEYDRPIYFFEHRERYICSWCDLTGDRLVIQPHPASLQKPSVFRFPDEIDLIGQVIGTAMVLDSAKRRHGRQPATAAATPGQ